MAEPTLTSRRTAATKESSPTARHAARQRSSATAPAAGGREHEGNAPASRAVSQLRRALGRRSEVVQLTRLASVLQRRSADGTLVQRAGGVEEEELLQSKPAPNRTGLPDGVKAGVESLSGMDLSDVRVHANSPQPAHLNALAYAQGSNIYVAPGQEQHLPHEAWHVVQQRQGRVQPTGQIEGVDLNDDRSLEAEADEMGSRALQTKRDYT